MVKVKINGEEKQFPKGSTFENIAKEFETLLVGLRFGRLLDSSFSRPRCIAYKTWFEAYFLQPWWRTYLDELPRLYRVVC